MGLFTVNPAKRSAVVFKGPAGGDNLFKNPFGAPGAEKLFKLIGSGYGFCAFGGFPFIAREKLAIIKGGKFLCLFKHQLLCGCRVPLRLFPELF